jgi:hypothetical protein
MVLEHQHRPRGARRKRQEEAPQLLARAGAQAEARAVDAERQREQRRLGSFCRRPRPCAAPLEGAFRSRGRGTAAAGRLGPRTLLAVGEVRLGWDGIVLWGLMNDCH